MDKKKLIKLFFLICILLPLSAASDITSPIYQVDHHNFGISGDDAEGGTYQAILSTQTQGIGTSEGTIYTVNLGWLPLANITYYCGDGTCNSGETCSSCVADCACSTGYTCTAGTCVADSIITDDSSSGGGDSSTSCFYQWICSEWAPTICPDQGIQKRFCVNNGTCTGTAGIPEQEMTCSPGQSLPLGEPLFDLFLNISSDYKKVLAGKDLKAKVSLINVGNTTTLDVFFKYWITTENNTVILTTQETIAISDKKELEKTITLPKEILPGEYKLFLQITYDKNKTAFSEDYFEVVEGKFQIFSGTTILFVLIGIIILTTIILTIVLIRILNKKDIDNTKEKTLT